MRKLLLLAALVCLPSTPAFTQTERYEGDDPYGPEQGDVEVTLSAAGSNDNDFDAGAFALSGSIGWFLTEGFELGGRHNMTFFDSENTDSTYLATTRAFVDYHFDLDRLQPFLGLNIGYRYGDSGIDETGSVAPEVGLKLFALEDTFLFGMAEYQIFFEDVDDADNNADDGQFVYSLGIGFLF